MSAYLSKAERDAAFAAIARVRIRDEQPKMGGADPRAERKMRRDAALAEASLRGHAAAAEALLCEVICALISLRPQSGSDENRAKREHGTDWRNKLIDLMAAKIRTAIGEGGQDG